MSDTLTTSNGEAPPVPTAVTWDTGAVAKPGPMTVVHPDRALTDADFADVAAGSGLNGPFIADLLSSCAAHENMGVNMFKALAAQSDNPASKKKFLKFAADNERAFAVYGQLMTAVGVSPMYVSQVARMTEAIDSKLLSAFLLSGSADPLTIELKGVESVLLAATLCMSNTSLLAALASDLDEGDVKAAMTSAVEQLLPAQQEHFEWAAEMQHTLVLSQAKSSLVQKVGQAVESLVEKVKDTLHQ